MITDLTWKRWKIGLYCSTNKHTYLSIFIMVWTYRSETGNSFLCVFCVYPSFFFSFLKDQESIIASYIQFKTLYSK